MSKVTCGSISAGAHVIQLSQKLERPASKLEVYRRIHRGDKGKGEFPDPKSKRIFDGYVDRTGYVPPSDPSQEPPPFDPKAWCQVAGEPKKGRVYGFGSQSSVDEWSPGSSTGPSMSSFGYEQEKEQLRAQLKEEVMANVRAEMDEELHRRSQAMESMMQDMMRRMLADFGFPNQNLPSS